jgi:hypothetical protein
MLLIIADDVADEDIFTVAADYHRSNSLSFSLFSAQTRYLPNEPLNSLNRP